MNVQVACTLDGEIVWISDPIEGSRHDMHCIAESDVLSGVVPGSWLADKGYIATGSPTLASGTLRARFYVCRSPAPDGHRLASLLARLVGSGTYERRAGRARIQVITAPSTSHAGQIASSPQLTMAGLPDGHDSPCGPHG